ncbi:MAG: hypothetical protein Kow00105_07250 [Phycisphaeraceae bacterium]
MNLVFHYGALGDFVLLLPILRGLAGPTTLVTAWPRAVLASRMVPGITPMDIQLWEFMRLHTEGGPTSVSPAIGELFEKATELISLVSNGRDAWAENVARLAPQANRVFVEPRPSDSYQGHLTEWLAGQIRQQGLAIEPVIEGEPTTDPAGPIAIHPGSGGEHKCWPADRYEAVIQSVLQAGYPVRVLLGETEIDRWPADRLEHWQTGYGAEVFETLDQLYEALSNCRAYLGNDSGPTHLAAQMGLPTLALFGPTDPTLWAPVGRNVKVLSPPSPTDMSWLEVQTVIDAMPLD